MQKTYPLGSYGNAVNGSAATGFDLIDVVRVLWKAKAKIILVTLLSLAVAMWIAFSLPKYYVAQGEVVVRAEASVAPDSDRAFNSTSINEAMVATERSVMAAEGLLSRVSDQVTFPPEVLRPSWFSEQVRRLRIALHMPEPPVADAKVEEAARRLAYLKLAVGTAVEKGSSVIAVVASTTNAEFSASIVNHLLDDYMKDRVVAQRAVAANVETALQERLRQTSQQIKDVQGRIAIAMRQPGLIENTEIPGLQRDLTVIGGQMVQARRDVAEKQAAYNSAMALQAQSGGNPARLAELLDNGSVSASDLRRQYSQKEQELAGLAQRYGADFPARAAVRSEVDSLGRRLSGEASRVIAQRKADLDAANQVLASLTGQYANTRNSTSRDSGALLNLQRDRDSLANLQRIAGSIEDRLLAVASQPVDPNARILTDAVSPLLSTYPNKPLIGVIGFAGGLIISSTVVIISAFLRRVRRSVLGQAAMFAGPLLGCIPRMGRIGRAGAGLLDALGQSRQGVSERAEIAFEGAALELDHAIARGGLNAVTITSALPQEGKSTVAMAISLKLAKLDRKVLLLHCDLHEGRARYFSRGSAVSVGGDRRMEIVQAANNLSVMDLPQTDSSIAFLQSGGFGEILESARRNYDIVICDTPPVLSVPDALVVARMTDAVVLVSEFKRKADITDISELSRRIDATGKPICGVIMTKVDETESGYTAYLGYKPTRGRRLALAQGR